MEGTMVTTMKRKWTGNCQGSFGKKGKKKWIFNMELNYEKNNIVPQRAAARKANKVFRDCHEISESEKEDTTFNKSHTHVIEEENKRSDTNFAEEKEKDDQESCNEIEVDNYEDEEDEEWRPRTKDERGSESEIENEKGTDTEYSDSDLEIDPYTIDTRKLKKRNSKGEDDGDEGRYQRRVKAWRKDRRKRRKEAEGKTYFSKGKEKKEEEEYLDDPSGSDEELESNEQVLRIPKCIWDKLYEYQKEGIKWMFERYSVGEGEGGILGDEMGLGKTVQVAGYIASMYHSKLLQSDDENGAGVGIGVLKPTLIVCPTTLIRQWVREINKWWAPLRVIVLHAEGSGIIVETSKRRKKGEDSEYCDDYGLDNDSVYYSGKGKGKSENDNEDRNKYNNAKQKSKGGLGAEGSASKKWQREIEDSGSEDMWEHDAFGWRVRKRKHKHRAYMIQKSGKKLKTKREGHRLSTERDEAICDLIKRVKTEGHVMITSYGGLKQYVEHLKTTKWGYLILDEGHMIKNPGTQVTQAAKQIEAGHRLVVSGTPVQNSLIELWSVFDFVFPGKLGSLEEYIKKVEDPITNGKKGEAGGEGESFGTKRKRTRKILEALSRMIGPYILRREKSMLKELNSGESDDEDVQGKSGTGMEGKGKMRHEEYIVMCGLTDTQKKLYTRFLDGEEMARILSGNLQVLYGIDYLRKVTNHPWLVLMNRQNRPGLNLGDNCQDFRESSSDNIEQGPKKSIETEADLVLNQIEIMDSGKMKALDSLIDDLIVKEMFDGSDSNGNNNATSEDTNNQTSNNKILVFAQTRQMLNIIEKYIVSAKQISYLRLDGTTPLHKRHVLVDTFNNDPTVKIFLLTTRVGGLGLNLASANTVIMYDPDWNPAVDSQAKHRALRISAIDQNNGGAKKIVKIYRLICGGCIEEKILIKQMYKTDLSNSVLESNAAICNDTSETVDENNVKTEYGENKRPKKKKKGDLLFKFKTENIRQLFSLDSDPEHKKSNGYLSNTSNLIITKLQEDYNTQNSTTKLVKFDPIMSSLLKLTTTSRSSSSASSHKNSKAPTPNSKNRKRDKSTGVTSGFDLDIDHHSDCSSNNTSYDEDDVELQFDSGSNSNKECNQDMFKNAVPLNSRRRLNSKVFRSFKDSFIDDKYDARVSQPPGSTRINPIEISNVADTKTTPLAPNAPNAPITTIPTLNHLMSFSLFGQLDLPIFKTYLQKNDTNSSSISNRNGISFSVAELQGKLLDIRNFFMTQCRNHSCLQSTLLKAFTHIAPPSTHLSHSPSIPPPVLSPIGNTGDLLSEINFILDLTSLIANKSKVSIGALGTENVSNKSSTIKSSILFTKKRPVIKSGALPPSLYLSGISGGAGSSSSSSSSSNNNKILWILDKRFW
ncbi:DNA repair protein rhp26 [Zancudomyces culisetae]|uniref:DNA repair protein rhp26 n=1 Tax=Zancudomyces culisetae TaxID=1213189 RepID=A0A1R1PTS3_ZANCU|nr:DNA repair protein rhp26 [Zancudomyces culisetae]|eukprot:OMH84396.1 DNA repair protein rhp26 [Zancudomyces culisetae]